MTFRIVFAAISLISLSVPVALAQHGSSHTTAVTAPASVMLGDIEITGAFSRATLPNAPVAAGFLTITNSGAEDDRLISATAPIAKATQIHEMAMEGDVMKMRHLAEGVLIAAGQSVTLEPGGYHIMFMGLAGALAEGDIVPVTLNFEKAGTVTVDLVVGGAAADAPAHGHDAGAMAPGHESTAQ